MFVKYSLSCRCFHCKNLECRSISHFDGIHKLHDDIISASIESSEVIPNSTVNKVNTFPGWDSSISYKKKNCFILAQYLD